MTPQPSRSSGETENPMTVVSKRPTAFVSQPGDEDRTLDGLGFFAWGAYRGEWSGTSTWLADAPLPEDVPDALVRPMAKTPEIVDKVRAMVSEGRTEAATLLAPVETASGFVVLPVQRAAVDVDPNYIAHIERAIPDGEWHTSEPVSDFMQDKTPRPVLVYVKDGLARAVVAPVKQEPDA